MLTGPNISPVQAYCNVLLDTDARIKEARRDDRQLGFALIAGGFIEDPAELFPELRKVVTDDAAEIAEGTDASGEPVATKFDFSHAELHTSQEEVEREIREMLAAAAEGSASFEAPDYDDWV